MFINLAWKSFQILASFFRPSDDVRWARFFLNDPLINTI
jgi:hypothetical protein